MQLIRRTDSGSVLAKRAPASIGLLAWALLAGPVTFAACGDDGSVLGSNGGSSGSGGGNAGQTSGGTGQASGGTGQASGGTGQASGGSSSIAGSGHAGTTSGGSTGTAGKAGTGGSGGGASCDQIECFRANVCLDKCGGQVVYSGCCACGANTVEQSTCTGAGGQGAGGQAGDCVGQTCNAGQTCVAYRVVGGAIDPPNSTGMCVAGKHVESNTCERDFAYTCAELTGCTALGPSCRCAQNTQCSNTSVCRLPTASVWLDTAADLVCELLAP